jgi:hypothetical protein
MNSKPSTPELSRRNFLKTTASLTLGAVAVGGHSLAAVMKGDLTGEVVQRLHAEGIRVIARLLKSGESLPPKTGADGKAACTVPVLNTYEVVLFEY